jgi:hypothetical protein
MADSSLMTTMDGVFACGNVLHVHDLVDWVTEESRCCGRFAAEWLRGERPKQQLRLKAGSNVRYLNPVRLNPERENHVYLRTLVAKSDAVLELRLDNQVIRSVKQRHVQPSEMINVMIGPKDFEGLNTGFDSCLEFSIM